MICRRSVLSSSFQKDDVDTAGGVFCEPPVTQDPSFCSCFALDVPLLGNSKCWCFKMDIKSRYKKQINTGFQATLLSLTLIRSDM